MTPVPQNYELRWAAALAVLAVVLTSLPFIIAPSLTQPGSTFTGFLINPIDGHSYLAKMRQGAELSLEFRLPYAADPGAGVALFVYQLILGGIGGIVGLPHILTSQAARVFGTLPMVATSDLFFSRPLPIG